MKIEAKGNILHPNVGIGSDYAKTLTRLIERMAKDAKREMRAVFESTATDSAMDESLAYKARVAINKLLDKWNPFFNVWAKKTTKRMIDRTVKNSAVTLGMSLKDISAGATLKADLIDDRLQDIISASTNEAVNLIKLIPQEYLGEVQGAVMRSITTGNGLKDLIPFMNEKYRQKVRHARLVAMDQTRKAYSNINAGRMQAIGVKKFEWIHSGGGQHPRPEHLALNGKVFDLNDLPVIGVMYGKEVRGKPGDLPNCRCVMRPIVSFED